jgi:hypothetical protein
VSRVLLKCIPTNERKALLDIHTDIYGHHGALMALFSKALRHDFY